MTSLSQLALDEGDKEIARLRLALNRIQAVLATIDDANHSGTVGRAREIALAVLNDDAEE